MTILWDPNLQFSGVYVGDVAPVKPADDLLWYNPTTDQLQYWDGSVWSIALAGTGGGSSGVLTVGVLPPSAPVANAVWYNPAANAWFLYDGAAWQPIAFSGGFLHVGGAAPVAPIINQLWFNPTTQDWQIWDGAAWATQSIGGGSQLPVATTEGQGLVSGPAPNFDWASSAFDAGRF